MEITLYINSSDEKTVNKNLESITTLVGNLRNGTSLLNPVFEIESAFDITDVDDIAYMDDGTEEDISYIDDGNSYDLEYATGNISILSINYIYVKEFNRYYFVNDINISNRNIFIFQCRVDVLMSFKNDFMSLNALIYRNQYQYNLDLEDNRMEYQVNKNVIENDIIDGPLVNTHLGIPRGLTIPPLNIVLACINNNGENVINNYVSSPIPSPIFESETTLWTQGLTGVKLYLLDYSMASTLIIQLLNDWSKYETGVISLKAYPFELPKLTDNKSKVKIYNDEISLSAYYLKHRLSEYFIISDFTYELLNPTYEDYHHEYYVYIPFADYIKLDPNDVINQRLLIYFTLDYVRGNEYVSIVNLTKNTLLYTSPIKLSYDIPITRTNAYEVNTINKFNNINLGVNALFGGVSMIGGLASGSDSMLSSGEKQLIRGGVDYFKTKALNYTKGTTSVGGSGNGGYLTNKPRLKIIKNIKCDMGSSYIENNGLPLNETKRLSDISGYTEVKEILLTNFSGTKLEADELISLLKRGIIL